MIVSRIATAAEVVLKEFKDTNIMALLQRAITVSANRQSMQDGPYNTEVNNLRIAAKKIMEANIINLLPIDVANMLYSSGYSSALPSNLAKIIYNGLSTVKTSSIDSPELILYNSAANNLQSELNNLLISFKKFKIDRITVPEGKISIDILIPRETAKNDIYYFSKVNNAFADVVLSFERLMGLPKEAPLLVYASTTDLVTGITIAVLALTPFLDFYNKMLDAAKKHIEILQGIKTLKNLPIKLEGEQNFSDQAEEATRQLIQNSIKSAVESAKSPIQDPGEIAEISNLISIRSKTIVNAISNGSRVSITVESIVELSGQEVNPEINFVEIKKILSSNINLGSEVTRGLEGLGDSIPLLIKDDSAHSD